MEIDFAYLNLDDLSKMHEQAERQLELALLNAEPWEKIRTKREMVTRLAIALHKRKYPLLPPGVYPVHQRQNPEF